MSSAGRKPPYQEAFPRFDIVRGGRAIFGGSLVCEFIDQRHRVLGYLRVIDRTESFIELEYELASPYVLTSHSSVRLDVVPAPNQSDPDRLSIVCPGCRVRTAAVFYIESWKCRNCHGLCYRSQLVDNYTLLFEKKNALYFMVKGDRPKGRHQRTHNRLKKEYGMLCRSLEEMPEKACSSAHSYIVSSAWREIRSEDFFFPLQKYY